MNNTIPKPIVDRVMRAFHSLAFDRATDGSDISIDDLIEDLVKEIVKNDASMAQVFKDEYSEALLNAAEACGDDPDSYEPVNSLDWIDKL